jgi:uncharacterized protein YbaP (TraB family)
MKRIYTFLCCLLVLFSCKAARQDNDKSLLWRITGKGLAKPSYLFGTIHLICSEDYQWTPAMQKSLSACKQVCFELDMDDPGVLLGASTGMLQSDGKQLQDYFTKAQWEKLSRFMRDSAGADISEMQMMKPMILESILTSKMVDCAMPVSYEANIMERAQKAKQEIIGLEEVQEQIDVLNGLPDDSVAASLVALTDSFSKAKAEYAQLVSAYKQQDLPTLFRLMQASNDLGDDLSAFVDDRNKKWIPRMSRIMSVKPTFFAVGAGHLWGDTGVIALLRKAGYTVTPVH